MTKTPAKLAINVVPRAKKARFRYEGLRNNWRQVQFSSRSMAICLWI
jgi:hypothetical protein